MTDERVLKLIKQTINDIYDRYELAALEVSIRVHDQAFKLANEEIDIKLGRLK